jgi:hypothetical protein
MTRCRNGDSTSATPAGRFRDAPSINPSSSELSSGPGARGSKGVDVAVGSAAPAPVSVGTVGHDGVDHRVWVSNLGIPCALVKVME